MTAWDWTSEPIPAYADDPERTAAGSSDIVYRPEPPTSHHRLYSKVDS